MNNPISDLQIHVQFQLSLLKLVDGQNGTGIPVGAPAAEIAEQEHLKDELAKIANAIH